MCWSRYLVFSSVFHKCLSSLAYWEIKFVCIFFKIPIVTLCILSSEVKYFSWSISTKANETNICLSITDVLPVTRNISKDKSTPILFDMHKRQIEKSFLSEFLQILEKVCLQTTTKALSSRSVYHFISAWSTIFQISPALISHLWHKPCCLHGTSCSNLEQLRNRNSVAMSLNLAAELGREESTPSS